MAPDWLIVNLGMVRINTNREIGNYVQHAHMFSAIVCVTCTWLAGDVKEPTHLSQRVGHGFPVLWSGLVSRVGASYRVNLIAPFPLVQEKLLCYAMLAMLCYAFQSLTFEQFKLRNTSLIN